MLRLLVVWLINAVALMALPYVFKSIHVADFTAALIAALVLGLINALIRPLLVLLTLPVTILTLGLFIFIINGFKVDGFWAGVFGAIVFSIISWALSALVLPKKS